MGRGSNGNSSSEKTGNGVFDNDAFSAGRSTDALQVSTGTGDEQYVRGQWGNKAEFILSCVGLSVGLGNVWRFPVLAYENGGGAFLIPYIILQLLIGKPMYFMELVMGQYSGQGPTGVWKLNPSAKGIGIAMAMISLVVAIYYNVIMAYCLYYFFATMQKILPWTSCKEEWLSEGCVVRSGENNGLQTCTGNYSTDFPLCVCTGLLEQDFYNVTDDCYGNNTLGNSSVAYNNCSTVCTNKTVSASSLYFYRDVIQKSEGLEPENIGAPIWYLALCLLLSWVIVVLCLIKGVKSSGKVVYFTATFPYVILLVLLVHGATLDGALDGVLYFLVPKWERLLELDVWRNAASQMFFSLSVSFGGIIMFGSYNKFKNNVYADSLFISVMDIVSSIIAGFVIFTTLGALAKEANIPIEEIAKKGPGLAFVAYPEALARLPVPHLWSLLFFFMLFTLGLDSEFALLETVLTCLQDEFPSLRPKKWLLCIISGAICFFLALPCVTPGGDYVVTLMDTYGASFAVLFVAACELMAVMWVYRVDRFMKDIRYMLGFRPHPDIYWLFCWAFAAPILVLTLLVYTFVKYEQPLYDNNVPFPGWAQVIGWLLAAVVMIPIPAWFVFEVIRQPQSGFVQKLKSAVTPKDDWGPNDGSRCRRPERWMDAVYLNNITTY